MFSFLVWHSIPVPVFWTVLHYFSTNVLYSYLDEGKRLIEGPGHGKVQEIGLVFRPRLGRPEPRRPRRRSAAVADSSGRQAFLPYYIHSSSCMLGEKMSSWGIENTLNNTDHVTSEHVSIVGNIWMGAESDRIWPKLRRRRGRPHENWSRAAPQHKVVLALN